MKQQEIDSSEQQDVPNVVQPRIEPPIASELVLKYTNSLDDIPPLKDIETIETAWRIIPMLKEGVKRHRLAIMGPVDTPDNRIYSQIVFIDKVKCNYISERLFEMDEASIYFQWYKQLRKNESFVERKRYLYERGIIYLIEYRQDKIEDKILDISLDRYIDPDSKIITEYVNGLIMIRDNRLRSEESLKYPHSY